MNIKKYLNDQKDIIDKALDRRLPKSGVRPKIIHKAMRYSVFSGGKRIRPILVLEACKACSKPGDKRALKEAIVMGCAVEMVHAYSLVHDDLPSMDNDDYRRGKLACHKAFGEANAILTGDALLTLAFNILSNNLDADNGIKAIKELSGAVGTFGMVGGQVIDIEHKGRSVGKAVKNRINTLKTARLFEASVILGAIAANASDSKMRAMSVFGRSIGDAFQIVDDIMDKDVSDVAKTKNSAANRAEDITYRAKKALKIFGDRACILKGIADLILKRAA